MRIVRGYVAGEQLFADKSTDKVKETGLPMQGARSQAFTRMARPEWANESYSYKSRAGLGRPIRNHLRRCLTLRYRHYSHLFRCC